MVMLSLLAAITAPLPSAPLLLNGRDVVVTDDIPPADLDDTTSTHVNFRVVVTPDGRPSRCEVLMLIGNSDRGSLTCALLMRRARFLPAKDISGTLSFGTYTDWVHWNVRGNTGTTFPPHVDEELSVVSLPRGIPNPVDIGLDLTVGSDGAIGPCGPSGQEKYPELTKAACAQFATLGRWKPVRDELGAPRQSIQQIVVRFSASASSPSALFPSNSSK